MAFIGVAPGLAGPSSVFPGDGDLSGPALSYTDNGDGTATDNNTGFMWEIKVTGDSGSCLDVDELAQ